MLMEKATETSGATREFNILEFSAQNAVYKSLDFCGVHDFVY